jgi:hypothetical protein
VRTDRRTDRRTDMTKLIVSVGSCANARKNGLFSMSEFESDIRRMYAFIGIRMLDNYWSRPVEAVSITQMKGAE